VNANVFNSAALHKKKIEVFIHTRLQPGDQKHLEVAEPFKRYFYS
jgi:hypothetical protein